MFAHAFQLNIVTFLAKRLFDTTKVAQAGNAGIPFKKVLEEAKFLSLPVAKVHERMQFFWDGVRPIHCFAF